MSSASTVEVGRFINSDALEYLGDGVELSNYNLFAYCGNNPTSAKDPRGTHVAGPDDEYAKLCNLCRDYYMAGLKRNCSYCYPADTSYYSPGDEFDIRPNEKSDNDASLAINALSISLEVTPEFLDSYLNSGAAGSGFDMSTTRMLTGWLGKATIALDGSIVIYNSYVENGHTVNSDVAYDTLVWVCATAASNCVSSYVTSVVTTTKIGTYLGSAAGPVGALVGAIAGIVVGAIFIAIFDTD